ncbi:pectin lyase-like superfamily protein [Wolffia australiana]
MRVEMATLDRLSSFLALSLLLLSQAQLDSSPPSHLLQLCSASVSDYGAAGDGESYDTAAIQAAVDEVAACGGGRVFFPPGDYLTAMIQLKSGVVMDVAEGARVLGGTRQEDYPSESQRWYVIVAEDAVDVGITGGGEISGQGWAFVQRRDSRKNVMISWNSTGDCLGDECRPRLIGFLRCRNVHVLNIHLTDPAYWCLHLVGCDNSSVTDVTILGDFDSPNNDGIDVEDSNNTAINRCHIDTGDDAICPKSSAGPVINLTVTDCWIRTKSSAVKLGSASSHDFRSFLFDRITIVDSHRGLSMQIRDGGRVSDVTFSNIELRTRYYDPSWWGRAEPIYVTACPREASSRAGLVSGVRFVNISGEAENGIVLSGSGGGRLRDLSFVNVNLTFRRWTDYSDGLIDYRPGCQGLVPHATAGVTVEHVSGMEMDGDHLPRLVLPKPRNSKLYRLLIPTLTQFPQRYSQLDRSMLTKMLMGLTLFNSNFAAAMAEDDVSRERSFPWVKQQ